MHLTLRDELRSNRRYVTKVEIICRTLSLDHILSVRKKLAASKTLYSDITVLNPCPHK